MPDSPRFRRLAKDCRLKAFRFPPTPAFSTLAPPTPHPFVSYLFPEHGGWGGLNTSGVAFPCGIVFGKGGSFLLLLSTVDGARSEGRMVWVLLSEFLITEPSLCDVKWKKVPPLWGCRIFGWGRSPTHRSRTGLSTVAPPALWIERPGITLCVFCKRLVALPLLSSIFPRKDSAYHFMN